MYTPNPKDPDAIIMEGLYVAISNMLGQVMAGIEYGDGNEFQEQALRDVPGLKAWWETHKKNFLEDRG